MSLVSLSVRDIHRARYNRDWKLEYHRELKLNSEDTYMVVFSVSQDSDKKRFLKDYGKDINILYDNEEKKALNSRPGHFHSRNNLVIFEKKDE